MTGGVLAALAGGVAPFLAQPDNFGSVHDARRAGAVAAAPAGLPRRPPRVRPRRRGRRPGDAGAQRRRPAGRPLRARASSPTCACAGRSRVGVGWRPASPVRSPSWSSSRRGSCASCSVFGSLSPSAASGRILFIHDYRELYSVTSDTTLAGFLAQGSAPLIASRVAGLVSALVIFAAVPLLVFLAPFTLAGVWQKRRDTAVRAMAHLRHHALPLQRAPVRGPRAVRHVPPLGGRAAAARLSPRGGRHRGDRGVGRPARARRGTRNRRPRSTLGLALVLVARARSVPRWSSPERGAQEALKRDIGAAMAGIPITDRVMSPDSGGYRYLDRPQRHRHARRPAAGRSRERRPRTTSVGSSWSEPTSWHSLELVVDGTERPAWLSAEPVHVVRATDGSVEGALFAVCFDTADTRCARP